MKTKSKIIIFICSLALIFSLVSVSCFASVDELIIGNRYVPSTDSSVYPAEPVQVNAAFTVAGELCISVEITDIGILFYGDSPEPSVAFITSMGWVDASNGAPLDVEFITYIGGNEFGEEYSTLLSVLDEYSDSDPESFYNQIFNSISGAVFGEDELTPEQNLSLSLISTVLSISVVLLPVLLACGWILRAFRL